MYDFNVGARNLTNMNAAPYEHVDVEPVPALHISPGRNHKQGPCHVANAAGAHMPLGSLCVYERIGIAVAFSIQRKPTKQSVIHRLFVKICVLRVMVCQIELVLKKTRPQLEQVSQ